MHYQSASFSLTPRLLWGRGVLGELGTETKKYGDKVFLIATSSAERSGILARVRNLFISHSLLFAESVYSGEPTLGQLNAALVKAKELGAAVVVAIGGGSAIDLAKATAGLFMEESNAEEYFYGKGIQSPGLPLITVPTVFGSGAEITPNAVITDENRQIKQSIRHPGWVARSVFIDPELSLNVPEQAMIYSGLDGLCQAVESYTSLGANAISDMFAREAAIKFATDLPKALIQNEAVEFRESLGLASALGGVALTAARLGLAHGLAHPIGVKYNVPHGKVCAVLLPMVMRFNLSVAYKKYASLAGELNLTHEEMEPLDQAVLLIEFILDINRDLKIPSRLRQLGITHEDFEALVKVALPSGSTKSNPREVQASELINFLKENW
jgi:alcohol dehydrogenase class IV